MENNIYRQAEFEISCHQPAQFPPDSGVEAAFAGRSNAGKSSVINTLTGRRALARVSRTPGRTQLINFFRLADGIRLVDLPGYGYASVPADLRRHWGDLVNAYLQGRRSLRGVVLITDIRRGLTDYDRMLLDWCADNNVPLCLLLNKADKLSRNAAAQALLQVRAQVPATGVQVCLFSALKRSGREELCEILDAWLVDAGKKNGPGGI